MKNPAHRPSRTYPEAPLHRCEVAMEGYPFCGSPLRSTCWREVDKYVQTLEGPGHGDRSLSLQAVRPEMVVVFV